MKKRMFLAGLFLVAGTTVMVAQPNQVKKPTTAAPSPSGGCIEVKGVDTKRESWHEPTSKTYGYFGYAFTNNNSFTVSIDAELYQPKEISNGDRNGVSYVEYLLSTKSFDLAPGETYVWKLALDYKENYAESETTNYKNTFRSWDNCFCANYVKFNAYKCSR